MTEPGDPRCVVWDGSMPTTTDPIVADEWDALLCSVGHKAITANRTAGLGGPEVFNGTESMLFGLGITVVIMALIAYCSGFLSWDCDDDPKAPSK